MTKGENSPRPDKVTVKAISILLELFTDEEIRTLEIIRNNVKVTLAEQFLARGGNHIPLADNPVIFRAQAIKVLEANKRYIELLEKVKKEDIFSALLDPENYVEKQKILTKSKNLLKGERIQGVSDASLNKNLIRSTEGQAALDKAWDYSGLGDQADRKRFDNTKLEVGDLKLINTKKEQEEGDDDVPVSDDKDASIVDEKERLDFKQMENPSVIKNAVTFAKEGVDYSEGREMLLHKASIVHRADTMGYEKVGTTHGFMENLKRQNQDTVKEKIILAEALNNIQNIEFSDIREKLYKKFDDLFYLDKKICRS